MLPALGKSAAHGEVYVDQSIRITDCAEKRLWALIYQFTVCKICSYGGDKTSKPAFYFGARNCFTVLLSIVLIHHNL